MKRISRDLEAPLAPHGRNHPRFLTPRGCSKNTPTPTPRREREHLCSYLHPKDVTCNTPNQSFEQSKYRSFTHPGKRICQEHSDIRIANTPWSNWHHRLASFLEEKQGSALGSDVWIQVIRRGPTGREQQLVVSRAIAAERIVVSIVRGNRREESSG